jgi:hypothetical protein
MDGGQCSQLAAFHGLLTLRSVVLSAPSCVGLRLGPSFMCALADCRDVEASPNAAPYLIIPSRRKNGSCGFVGDILAYSIGAMARILGFH